MSGNVWVTLSGIEVNATADMGIICNQCRLLTLDRTVTVGSYTNGVAIIDGSANLLNDNSIANFSTLGLAGVHAFIQQTSAGTVTITGGNTTATFCLNLEHGSQYSLLSNTATPAAANVTISNCFYGVLLGSSSLASVVSTGTFSVSNASTPSNSNGFWVGEHSTVDLTPEHLFVDHFTTCVNVVGLSIFQQGPGNRTTSNCTASATAQSSVYFVF